MHIEIICNSISSLDPQRLCSQRAYLRMCVEMTTEQAIYTLEGFLANRLIDNLILKQALKDHRADLIESIEEDAVATAGEAYWAQRDRMATS
jgi:hypothetical protein